MFDDDGRNFLMNPQSGLKIKAFRNAFGKKSSVLSTLGIHRIADYMDGRKDKELKRLIHYLVGIAGIEDFTQLDHRYWEKVPYNSLLINHYLFQVASGSSSATK